jgi:hypothetical protein
MPAPKAVLRDIHEYGLDPAVAHSEIGKNGRLKVRHVTVSAPAPAPIKMALKELPKAAPKPVAKVEVAPPPPPPPQPVLVKEEPKVEATPVEEAKAVEEVVVDDVATPKKGKKTKALKPEDPSAS